jgi:hypothetical protein
MVCGAISESLPKSDCSEPTVRPREAQAGLSPNSEKQYQTPAGLARHCRFFVEPRLGGSCDTGAVDRLGFLVSWLFRRETPDHAYWILLDFLGFSRQNRDFSMGCTAFSPRENFSCSFAAGSGGGGTGAGILTMRKRSMAHRTSLTHFLLFCNQSL